MSHSLLIAGATGLIGAETLAMALSDPSISRVIAPVRRSLVEHQKLEQWVNSDLLQALRPAQVDAVICCLGTTIKTAGNKEAFRHVDYTLVVALGAWAKANGAHTFSVVSAIGANAGSGVFYNRVKGEMERDLKALGLRSLHIFQPSILTGPREEKRLGERIGITVMKLLAPLTPSNYKPMPHNVLAAALLNSTRVEHSGTYTYKKVLELANASALLG